MAVALAVVCLGRYVGEITSNCINLRMYLVGLCSDCPFSVKDKLLMRGSKPRSQKSQVRHPKETIHVQEIF
jgi:hypothetical protein